MRKVKPSNPYTYSLANAKVPFLAPDVSQCVQCEDKNMKTDLTQAEVRRMLDYDPDTGVLTWRVERYRKHPGDIAGCIRKALGKNYWSVTVNLNYRRYQAARIIWLWMTGEWPKHEVDHIDRDATNNRWENLRETTHHENGRNLSLKSVNWTGFTGVCKGRNGKYRARIMINRRDIYLGEFATITEAAEARNRAARKYFGDFRGETDA